MSANYVRVGLLVPPPSLPPSENWNFIEKLHNSLQSRQLKWANMSTIGTWRKRDTNHSKSTQAHIHMQTNIRMEVLCAYVNVSNKNDLCAVTRNEHASVNAVTHIYFNCRLFLSPLSVEWVIAWHKWLTEWCEVLHKWHVVTCVSDNALSKCGGVVPQKNKRYLI